MVNKHLSKGQRHVPCRGRHGGLERRGDPQQVRRTGSRTQDQLAQGSGPHPHRKLHVLNDVGFAPSPKSPGRLGPVNGVYKRQVWKPLDAGYS